MSNIILDKPSTSPTMFTGENSPCTAFLSTTELKSEKRAKPWAPASSSTLWDDGAGVYSIATIDLANDVESPRTSKENAPSTRRRMKHQSGNDGADSLRRNCMAVRRGPRRDRRLCDRKKKGREKE